MATINHDTNYLYSLKPSIEGREYRYKSLELLDFMGYLNKVTGAKNPEEFLNKFVTPELKWAKGDDGKALGDLIVCGPFDMVFSERAKNLLQTYLGQSGVIVPIQIDGITFYAYKTWKVFDSIADYDGLTEFAFNKNQKAYLFVSEKVKQLIEDAGLTGFEFEQRTELIESGSSAK